VEDLFKGFGTQEMYTSESTDEDGNTILNAAAKWGHKRLVRRALKWACDVNHMNDDGLTAVEMAVRGALMYWCIDDPCWLYSLCSLYSLWNTSSTDNTMNRHARITLNGALIRACSLIFLFDV
jgi:hypothetical protein